jgi:pyruvate,water dikinase
LINAPPQYLTTIESEGDVCLTEPQPQAHPGAAVRFHEYVTDTPDVVALDDPRARDTTLTGAKSAALATAAAGGFATLPGVVLTTRFAAQIDAGADVARHRAVRTAFLRAGGGQRALVVRSSAVAEDGVESSMAGQFESVIGVRGVGEMVSAVRTVLRSRERTGDPTQPMAVLIQPLLEPVLGGVMFGVDPVSGRADRRVVSAVEGAPEPLVSGRATGSRYELDARGRVVASVVGDGPELTHRQLRALARTSSEAARMFGSPQDIEWAIDAGGMVWLLQSRPVTTEVRGTPVGPVYGPGPLAETLPARLTRLEQDLWVAPLREAVREAVALGGSFPRRRVDGSEGVVVVDGQAAIDLELAGEITTARRILHRLNPWPAARGLARAWRHGRLRSALPSLADRVLERADADMAAVPPLAALTTRQLATLLPRTQAALRALHAHEILLGTLVDAGHSRLTSASVALDVLADAREAGLGDAEIIEREPIVLVLTPATVGPRAPLPREVAPVAVPDDAGADDALRREALRVRVRWMQELSARAAWEIARRLTAEGALQRPEQVRDLALDELVALVTGIRPATRVVDLRAPRQATPLPARFQLSELGRPIAVSPPTGGAGATGAGGGTGRGIVTHDAADPPLASVLVTSTLTPGLGPLLPRLNGIVAETGSVLSHLAILAREAGVPTVVGYAGALDALPAGTAVEVDGDAGAVVTTARPAADEEVTA